MMQLSTEHKYIRLVMCYDLFTRDRPEGLPLSLLDSDIPLGYQKLSAASFLFAARFFRLKPYRRQHAHPVRLISRSPGFEPDFLQHAYNGFAAVVPTSGTKTSFPAGTPGTSYLETTQFESRPC